VTVTKVNIGDCYKI